MPVDSGEDGSALPDAAVAVASPVLTPCPTGWSEVLHPSGIAMCEPFPDGARAACPLGSIQAPGDAACRPLGALCPADGWPADLPVTATILYVDAGAAAGGDGTTRATAYATVTEAVSAAPPGALVAIAAGRYAEDVYVTQDLTLVGACAADTVIAPQGGGAVFVET